MDATEQRPPSMPGSANFAERFAKQVQAPEREVRTWVPESEWEQMTGAVKRGDVETAQTLLQQLQERSKPFEQQSPEYNRQESATGELDVFLRKSGLGDRITARFDSYFASHFRGDKTPESKSRYVTILLVNKLGGVLELYPRISHENYPFKPEETAMIIKYCEEALRAPHGGGPIFLASMRRVNQEAYQQFVEKHQDQYEMIRAANKSLHRRLNEERWHEFFDLYDAVDQLGWLEKMTVDFNEDDWNKIAEYTEHLKKEGVFTADYAVLVGMMSRFCPAGKTPPRFTWQDWDKAKAQFIVESNMGDTLDWQARDLRWVRDIMISGPKPEKPQPKPLTLRSRASRQAVVEQPVQPEPEKVAEETEV